MKKTRKILSSWIMAVCMILNFSNIIVQATDYSASRVVDYVNSMVGQSYANGYCLKFIEESYQKFYGFRAYSCCAYKSGSSYLDSTSRDIPLGASVFFGGSNVSCGSCGNKAGHIGIYVGNNNIVHAWGGKIVSTTIDYVVSCGYPYRGWGWMCNTALTTDTKLPNNITITADKTEIGIGDTVNFTYTIDNATYKYIGIDRAGGNRYTTIPLSSSSGTISYTFTEAGTYCVITEGSNSLGYTCCGGVYIYVSSTSPSNITIKADKTEIVMGDSVTFTYTINNAISKHIGIDVAGGNRYHSIPLSNSSGSVTYTFTEPGIYCVITEGYNAVGYNCCDGTYIYVSYPKYALNFNPNGGTTPITNKTVTYNSTYGELPTPTRIGYKFLGWFTSETGGTQITSNSLVTITSDQTLYAQWEQASVKATLTDLGAYKLCEVTGENINTDCTVFVVGYKENIPVNVQSRAYSDNLKAFAIMNDIDMVKVFLWNNISGMTPIAGAAEYPITN